MDKITIYKLESNYKSHVYNSGKWVDGFKIKELEEKIKEYLQVKYVVLTNNGTSSLLAAYWVLKNEFKKLKVDPYTFPATYQAARVLNYKIEFSRTITKEVDENYFRNDSLHVITHLFGQPNNMLVYKDKINFIEDACQAFGTKYKDKKVGTFGKIGCFSFYPTKMLHTCGHGGAVVTNDESYYQKLKVFIESGRVNGEMTEEIGLNLRMDELKAEFLLWELKEYDKRIATQRDIAKKLIKLVQGNQPFLEEKPDYYHIYSTFNMLIKNRDEFIKYMNNLDIQTMIYYGKNILPSKIRNQYADLTSSIVAIPCRWNLKEVEIKRIKNALKGWFQ